jgi:hypothetical protein
MKVSFESDKIIDLDEEPEEQPKSILKKSSHKSSSSSKRSGFNDSIPDWTKEANKSGHGDKIKKDSNYEKHYIKPCSMICAVGPTGSGKSTSIVDFLARKNNSFFEIIYFTGSTADEALLGLLKKKIDGIEILDNVAELPVLTDYNDSNKSQEKCMIFDDVINLPKKELKIIQAWFASARKYGFTVFFLAQDYTSIPIQIRRNIMIWILFRLHDNNTITNILKTHNSGDDKQAIKRAYLKSTESKGNFFMISFNSDRQHKYRHNFLDFIDIPEE